MTVAAASGDVTVEALIGLARDPVAVFDDAGTLRAVNAAFRTRFAALGSVLSPGTPWDILLSEAAHRGALPHALCDDLNAAHHAGRHWDGQVLSAALPGGDLIEVRLSDLDGAGHAMTISVTSDPAPSSDRERELEELMARVLEACPTSLTMSRVGDGQIIYRSPSATELLGKGKSLREHFEDREERADFITELLPSARVDDMPFTARHADGTTFPATISARLIDYRGEDMVVSSIENITDEIAVQTQLARQKDQIHQSEKLSALGELLAGVAHELNNPLSIVIGNAAILREDAGDDASIKRIDKLSDAAERCVRIVRTFLSLARERPLEIEAVSPRDMIEMAVDAFQSGEASYGIDVDIRVSEDIPDIAVDETQIVQVISNLLTNAGQAMAESGTGSRIEIATEVDRARQSFSIHLVDDGPGVPEDIRGRIFDPLFTTKAMGKGTGIGLALCHRIVSAHGGTIELRETASGRGACFVIELPGRF